MLSGYGARVREPGNRSPGLQGVWVLPWLYMGGTKDMLALSCRNVRIEKDTEYTRLYDS